MNKFAKTLLEIVKIIENNSDVFNRRYANFGIEISYDGMQLQLFVPTLFRELPNKNYCEKIKKLFDAVSVSLIPVEYADYPAFWCIRLWVKDFEKEKEREVDEV